MNKSAREAITAEILRLKKEKERFDAYILKAKALIPLANGLDTQEIEGITFIDITGETLYIHITVPAFLSFEAEDLSNLIEQAEALTHTEAESQDDPDSNYRIYRIGPVKIFATPSDDALCKRVVVGTKEVITSKYVEVAEKQPVYAYEC